MLPNLLFYGSPGTGKSMLASRLPGILPPLEEEDALQVAAVRSVANGRSHGRERQFRAPHYTASAIALVGGGSHPKLGEISLAHQGVLFLDELPEFPRSVLEALREPMESGQISISRANAQVARTLADMAASADIGAQHLSEALGYRSLDRALS